MSKDETSSPDEEGDLEEIPSKQIQLPLIEYDEMYQFSYADGVQTFISGEIQGRLIFFRRDPIFEDLLGTQGPGFRPAKVVITSEVAIPYKTMIELRDALNKILPVKDEED